MRNYLRFVYLCARKHKAAHSGVIGPVMGRRNRARRSYMRLLISNSLIIIDFITIIIITLLLASSSLTADYVEIKKYLTAFKYQLSILKCVYVTFYPHFLEWCVF